MMSGASFKNKERVKAHRRGIWAEHIARFYLRLKGYRILEHRYKTYVGEIDIIARKGHIIVFAEVKSRRTKEEALQAVHLQNQKRITRAAQDFLMRNDDLESFDMRFDVIVVNALWPFSVHHLDNAWMLPS